MCGESEELTATVLSGLRSERSFTGPIDEYDDDEQRDQHHHDVRDGIAPMGVTG
jgi:hypothetical protein